MEFEGARNSLRWAAQDISKNCAAEEMVCRITNRRTMTVLMRSGFEYELCGDLGKFGPAPSI